jgi:hypothetical protein
MLSVPSNLKVTADAIDSFAGSIVKSSIPECATVFTLTTGVNIFSVAVGGVVVSTGSKDDTAALCATVYPLEANNKPADIIIKTRTIRYFDLIISTLPLLREIAFCKNT